MIINIYAWIGLIVSWLILIPLYLATIFAGRSVWKRLRRIYHMSVLSYWLVRLEEEGTHVFERASAEKQQDNKE